MNKVWVPLMGLMVVVAARAALPPQFQNAKDLDVMVEFVKKHALVMSSLRSVEVQRLVVNFGTDCQVVFGRVSTPKQPDLPGPQGALEFKTSTCPVD